MAAVRVYAQTVEVSAKKVPPVRVVRQAAEVAAEDDGSGPVRVQRQAVEVSAKTPARVRVTRQAAEVAAEDDGTGTVRVQWQGVEISAKVASAVRVVRQAAEVVAEDDSDGTGTARVQRQAAEISARVGVTPPSPLALPLRLDLFLHNWAQTLELETAYETDVTRSPLTGAESRLGLLERPTRLLKVQWLRSGQDELDRLAVWLRRITAETLALPLYQDAVMVTANSGIGQRNIYCTAAYRRFVQGGRIAVFPISKTWLKPEDVRTHTVSEVYEDRVVVSSNLTAAYGARQYIVVPLIDVEKMLDPSVLYRTDRVAEVQLEVAEVHGKNSLPPSYTGSYPPGWQLGPGNLPIWEIGPDWTNGVRATFRRDGDVRQEGRTKIVVPSSPRALQVQDYPLLLQRADWWRLLQFFDAMRGRLGAFWEVDREWIWTATDTDPLTIDISPLGNFTDFSQQMTGYVGIVMRDGTVHIREVDDVQQALGSWRLALTGEELPAINVSQIDRVSRARVKRFDSDALLERWITTESVRVEISTAELIAEGEVDIG